MSEIDWEALQAPIDRKYIKQVNKGYGPRSYVDAPALMQRLDDVLTPAGWGEEIRIDWHGDCPTAVCILSIKTEHGWLAKTGVGGPNNLGRSTSESGRTHKDKQGKEQPAKDGPLFVEDDEPAKSAASDAFRRACRTWGIGRELWLQGAAQKGTQASQERRSAPAEGGDTSEESRGVCPVHNVPFTHKVGVSEKTDKPYDFWSCPERDDDGNWCDQKPKRSKEEQKSLAESAPAEDDGDTVSGETASRGVLLNRIEKQFGGLGIVGSKRKQAVIDWPESTKGRDAPPLGVTDLSDEELPVFLAWLEATSG